MKKFGYHSIIHLYILLFVIMCTVTALFAGSIIYAVSTVMPNGKTVLNKWPIDFTNDFSPQIIFDGGSPRVTDEGKALLVQDGLWLQILDENGAEVFNHNKPPTVRAKYSPMELLNVYESAADLGYTLFIKKTEDGNNKEYAYIIAFPVQIERITLFVDANRFTSGRPIAILLLLAAVFITLILGGAYGLWITGQLYKIMDAVKKIALRSHFETPKGAMFGDIYDSLNKLDVEILRSDEERRKTESARDEWIANITHDLKTPLSPIKGYGELLSEGGCLPVDAIKYGEIILKNTIYAENLVDDLKLTYQLKNNMFPVKREDGNITRFIKEIVIDVLNDPKFKSRNIEFSGQEINWAFDRVLMRRAFYNILYNEVTHNPPETEIFVSLRLDSRLRIKIRDNGRGMKPEELERLFERYYRGANTEENNSGTGLGMAIAKQIAELHGGEIIVESAPGIGTGILINFPLSAIKT